MYEIKEILEKQGEAFTEFKNAQNERIKNLESALNEFAKKAARPMAPSYDGGNDPEAREHKQAFLGYLRSGRERGLGAKAMATDNDPNGGYLVPKQIDSITRKHYAISLQCDSSPESSRLKPVIIRCCTVLEALLMPG
jgi:HK97 family phage major capsid protein